MVKTVLQLPGGPTLRLKDLVGPSGKGLVASWLSGYPGARAKFRVRVKYLRLTPQAQWTKKQFRNLGSGIWEIKWKFNDKEFRAVGFYYEGFFHHAGGLYPQAKRI